MNPFVPVVMAGGKGQRFWPLSTESKPKQFLDLDRSGRTLIQKTVDRVAPLAGGPEHVLIATGTRYVDLVREQLPEVPEGNLLVEPVGRDSGPAIALASMTIERRYGPEAVAGFFSSDHLIKAEEPFRAAVRDAIEIAESRYGLVTIGIRPTRAATGYGYIEQGAPAGPGFRVARFVEKPNQQVAERYLADGGYLWNAGIFVWKAGVVIAELQRHAPDLVGPLREALERDDVQEAFPRLRKISIDYALMEPTDRAYVVPGEFDWDDIGDWMALERLLTSNGNGGGDGLNTVVGRHVGLDASGNIVYTEGPDDIVATLGVEGLVIVKRGDAVLIARKDRVQDIKRLLEDRELAEMEF